MTSVDMFLTIVISVGIIAWAAVRIAEAVTGRRRCECEEGEI